MKQTKQNEHDVPVSQSSDEKSPYLPSPQGVVKEKIARLKYSATYWIWKRMIRRYSHAWRSRCTSLSFLDVGCGPGNFLCCLESWFKGDIINGLDTNKELLKYAAERTATINLWQASAEELPFEAKTFHVISGLHVIEHLERPEMFFREANRVLKRGGLLLLATPNIRSLAARVMRKRWIGVRHDHISLRSAQQWHETLEENGFTVLDEGTTFFRGIPLIGHFPLGTPFQLIQVFWGWLPWLLGASYMVIAKKEC